MIRLALITCAALACMAIQSPAAEDKPSMEKPKIADREYVKLVTNKGDVYLELNQEKAPISVKNFLDYVDSGFYNGTVFHRVIDGFMIQGGGFDKEKKQRSTRSPIKNEWQNGLKNRRGTIAMARTASPDSATAQFFINVVDNKSLDQPISGGAGYAVFGRVLKGMDVVDKIKGVSTSKDAASPNWPLEPIVIEKAMKVSADELKNEIAALRKQEAEEQTAMTQTNAAPMEAGKSFVKARGIDVSKGTQSPSGLWFVDEKIGSGAGSSSPSDSVTVHYTGWLTNGTKFDSSRDRGETIDFPLNGVIRGWTEGVGSMKVGGKRYLVIPPDLAYGSRAMGSIPPNSVLVFEVELLGVNGK